MAVLLGEGLAATAFKGALTAGQSILGTGVDQMLKDQNVRVTCGVEVENWTRFVLTDANARAHWGNIEVPPRDILPGFREVVVANKTSICATGSTGMVSWLVEGTNRRVVVLWSAPFNFDFYRNVLAVGITEEGVSMDHQFYDLMLYHRDDEDALARRIKFAKAEYGKRKVLKTISVSDGGLTVKGTMGTTHRAIVRITVRPTDLDSRDIAPAVAGLICHPKGRATHSRGRRSVLRCTIDHHRAVSFPPE